MSGSLPRSSVIKNLGYSTSSTGSASRRIATRGWINSARGDQHTRLLGLLAYDLKTVRANGIKKAFERSGNTAVRTMPLEKLVRPHYAQPDAAAERS
jgi:hypothetical protein